MTVSDERPRSRLRAARAVNDVAAGDYVRRTLGSRKVGLVEEVHAEKGCAWVAWSPNFRSYLPLAMLRKIHPSGHEYDARKK